MYRCHFRKLTSTSHFRYKTFAKLSQFNSQKFYHIHQSWNNLLGSILHNASLQQENSDERTIDLSEGEVGGSLYACADLHTAVAKVIIRGSHFS